MKKENRLLLILGLCTAFDLLLIVVRLYFVKFDVYKLRSVHDLALYRGTTGTFFFLAWNLVLAWVPFLIALGLEKWYNRTKSKGLAIAGLFFWLLFFPNAPYIITDFLHLQDRPLIPHWYDVMLFVSFAWTGLMLGFGSLYLVQRFVKTHLSSFFSWCVTVGAIMLGSFGVFIGRFQRWNSWDVFTQPVGLIKEIGYTLIHPAAHVDTLGITVVLFGFLLLAYITFWVWGTETIDN